MMRTLTLVIVIICACYIISRDQHVSKATVFLEDRTVENARLDRRLFSDDIQVSESSGTVYVVPAASIAYTTYAGPSWHFGPLALSAILIVLICAMGSIGYFVFEMTA